MFEIKKDGVACLRLEFEDVAMILLNAYLAKLTPPFDIVVTIDCSGHNQFTTKIVDEEEAIVEVIVPVDSVAETIQMTEKQIENYIREQIQTIAALRGEEASANPSLLHRIRNRVFGRTDSL